MGSGFHQWLKSQNFIFSPSNLPPGISIFLSRISTSDFWRHICSYFWIFSILVLECYGNCYLSIIQMRKILYPWLECGIIKNILSHGLIGSNLGLIRTPWVVTYRDSSGAHQDSLGARGTLWSLIRNHSLVLIWDSPGLIETPWAGHNRDSSELIRTHLGPEALPGHSLGLIRSNLGLIGSHQGSLVKIETYRGSFGLIRGQRHSLVTRWDSSGPIWDSLGVLETPWSKPKLIGAHLDSSGARGTPSSLIGNHRV